MEINVVELIVQAGGLGLAALLVFLVVRYGGAYLDKLTSRLLDNLDQQQRDNRKNRQKPTRPTSLGRDCPDLPEQFEA